MLSGVGHGSRTAVPNASFWTKRAVERERKTMVPENRTEGQSTMPAFLVLPLRGLVDRKCAGPKKLMSITLL